MRSMRRVKPITGSVPRPSRTFWARTGVVSLRVIQQVGRGLIQGGLLLVGCSSTPVVDQGTPLPDSETVVDVFRQVPQPSLDILWVVDNTRSMRDELSTLSTLFDPFIQALQEQDIAWQVGVITTDLEADHGQLQGVPTILTPSVTDVATVFAQKMQAILEQPSSAQEQGLEGMRLALTPPNTEPDQPNYGFLRSDALLSVIVVSDSDDASPQEVSDYAELLTGLKDGDGSRVRFDAVVGPTEGCPGALPGSRYIQLAGLMGGTASSICSEDWTLLVATLGQDQLEGQSQFLLSREPFRTDDMVVTVAGVVSSMGVSWRYNAEVRAVEFEVNAIPPLDAVIRVTYQATVPTSGAAARGSAESERTD